MSRRPLLAAPVCGARSLDQDCGLPLTFALRSLVPAQRDQVDLKAGLCIDPSDPRAGVARAAEGLSGLALPLRLGARRTADAGNGAQAPGAPASVPNSPSLSTRTCSGTRPATNSPTTATTRARSSSTSATATSRIPCATPSSVSERFKGFWRDTDEPPCPTLAGAADIPVARAPERRVPRAAQRCRMPSVGRR